MLSSLLVWGLDANWFPVRLLCTGMMCHINLFLKEGEIENRSAACELFMGFSGAASLWGFHTTNNNNKTLLLYVEERKKPCNAEKRHHIKVWRRSPSLKNPLIPFDLYTIPCYSSLNLGDISWEGCYAALQSCRLLHTYEVDDEKKGDKINMLWLISFYFCKSDLLHRGTHHNPLCLSGVLGSH